MSQPEAVFGYARWLASVAGGLSLLAAAAVKARDVILSRASAGVLEDAPVSVVVALIASEVVLAAWLLSGWKSPFARPVAGATFFLFSLVSAWAASGNRPCGCFGALDIPAWATCALDASLAVLLLPRLRLLPVCALIVVVPLGAATRTGDEKPIRLLAPDEWVGTSFPLFAEAGMDPKVRRGSWKFLFFHPHCPRCQEALHHPAERGVAINVSDVLLSERPPGWLIARLDPRYEWLMETPVIVRVSDGIVTAVSRPP
jgi:hypothetical protein